MTAIERALYELNEIDGYAAGQSFMHSLDPRSKALVTVLYIIAVLSFRLDSLSGILFMWIFPILFSALGGISYNRVFLKSLYVLPLILFIGMFNPVMNREPMLQAGSITVSRGWVEFISIVLRGLLAVQASLILVMTTGFQKICYGLERMGIPAIFTTQLLMVYRYLSVLLQEAASMDNARRSRGYGKRSYSPRLWGIFIGQLLIRTVARAERIHRAMLSRGFDGTVALRTRLHWTTTDTLFLIISTALFTAARLTDFSHLFNMIISRQ